MSRLTQAQIKVLDLTFGVEMEGRAQYRDKETFASRSTDYMDVEIRGALSHQRVRMYGKTNSDHWRCVQDSSIQQVEGWGNFELISRVLHANESSDWQELDDILGFLHQWFEVSTDETCGLHVHVGVGNRGLPLRTLQNFAAIVTAFEHLLATLHPMVRQYSKVAAALPLLQDDDFYCNGPGESGKLSGEPVIDRLLGILRSRSWDGLHGLMSLGAGNKYSAYNFESIIPSFWQAANHRTIEFRQAAASFDKDQIKHWAGVCIGLIMYAYCCTDKQLRALLDNLQLSEDEFTVTDLLSAMNLDAAAEFYKGKTYPLCPYIEVPCGSPATADEINDALKVRPTTMKDVEAKRAEESGTHVEDAMGERDSNGIYMGAFRKDFWVPYAEFPFKRDKSYAQPWIDCPGCQQLRSNRHCLDTSSEYWMLSLSMDPDMPESDSGTDSESE